MPAKPITKLRMESEYIINMSHSLAYQQSVVRRYLLAQAIP